MNRTVYEDYKYCMQDVSTVYVGSQYTFEELLEDENIPFKLKLVLERYVCPDYDPQDTLETHLYYLEEKSFIVKIYRQLKARVKVNLLVDKKSLFTKRGSHKKGSHREYITKTIPVEELVKLSVEEKERVGLVVQELSVSKLALMGF